VLVILQALVYLPVINVMETAAGKSSLHALGGAVWRTQGGGVGWVCGAVGKVYEDPHSEASKSELLLG